MNKIKIFETTLRDGEQSPGCTMKIEDKVEIAKKLDKMGVDIIEAGFAYSNKNDYEAIKRISKVCNNSTICSLARCNIEDIDCAYEALKEAKHKRLHIFIATSDIHMKYKLRKTKEEVKEIVKKMVRYAKTKFDDIEFSLEDATRTNKKFACEIIDIAIENGATTINIPDTVGVITPDEFYKFIRYIRKNSNIDNVNISVHCHNDLGLATANSVAAIRAGANQIECTVNGIGERAGNTALEEIVCIMDVKKDVLNSYCDIDTTKIYEISKMVSKVTGSFVQNNKAVVGKNAFKHEAGIHQAGILRKRETYEIINPNKYGIYEDGIVLGIHSGKNAFINKIKELGFDPEKYNIDQIIKEQINNMENNNNKFIEKDYINIINKYKKSLVKC